MITHYKILAAMLGLVFSAGALASWPDEQTYKGTTFVTGGVGSTESKEMREAASRYSLAVTFVGTIGEYLTKVGVKVKNSAGDVVLDTITEGPILLAHLQPGSYTVEGTYEAQTVVRKVSVAAGKNPPFVMRWQTNNGTREQPKADATAKKPVAKAAAKKADDKKPEAKKPEAKKADDKKADDKKPSDKAAADKKPAAKKPDEKGAAKP